MQFTTEPTENTEKLFKISPGTCTQGRCVDSVLLVVRKGLYRVSALDSFKPDTGAFGQDHPMIPLHLVT